MYDVKVYNKDQVQTVCNAARLTNSSAHPFRRLFSHSHLIAFFTCCSCCELYFLHHIIGVARLFGRCGDGCVGIHCGSFGSYRTR